MCGKADVEGCGSADKHVVEIEDGEPAWMPADYRIQALGQYTFRCTRCDSFPGTRWPSENGAWAGMMLHLGGAHNVGKFQGGSQRLSMIPVK